VFEAPVIFTIAFCSVSCHISTSFDAPFTSIPNTLPLFFCVSVISLLSPCIEPAFVKSEPMIKLSSPLVHI